jgi:hypothetical protein
MSLLYYYKPVRVGLPVTSLGFRSVRPRPVIPVTLIGPQGSILKEALLDTGADDTVFPEALASRIGVDLTRAPSGSAVGVGMRRVLVRHAQVTLRLATRVEHRE